MAATMEGEVGKGASLDECARDGREEGGGRRVLYCTHITTGSSQKLLVIGTFTAGSLGPQSVFEFSAIDPAMKGHHCWLFRNR
jgi:hypothetical protein